MPMLKAAIEIGLAALLCFKRKLIANIFYDIFVYIS